MSKAFILIASWEDRFISGVRAVFSTEPVEQVICFASNRYEARTKENCETLSHLSKEQGANLELVRLNFGDVVQVDSAIQKCLDRLVLSKISDVIFDISTAPRHIIWGVLSALSGRFDRVEVQYVRAASYGDWQTDEDQDPRLVLNCSGIIYPDLPTCLVMMCGPEVGRAEKMFYKFEPRHTLILRDVDAASQGEVRSFDYSERSNVEELSFDNKDLADENFARLCALVHPYIGGYNIVCSSFGPKLGSILLFRLVRKFPEIALAYVPAGIHNIDLSKGASRVTHVSVNLRDDRKSEPSVVAQ